jgi:predicted HNH restriction endonuclease
VSEVWLTREETGDIVGKKLPYTPTSTIRSLLRQLWLRSRERNAVLRAAGYTCQRCGKKQSKAAGREVKVEVHHKDGIKSWERVFQVIREEILCPPQRLEVLCTDCHKKEGG